MTKLRRPPVVILTATLPGREEAENLSRTEDLREALAESGLRWAPATEGGPISSWPGFIVALDRPEDLDTVARMAYEMDQEDIIFLSPDRDSELLTVWSEGLNGSEPLGRMCEVSGAEAATRYSLWIRNERTGRYYVFGRR